LRSARAAEGLDWLIHDIDRQAARANLSMTSYGNFMLPSWLVTNRRVHFNLMSTDDIVWISAWTITTRTYGIKTAMRGEVHVVDRFGRRIAISGADLNAGIRQIHARAPWAVVGPDAEMVRAFGKKGNAIRWEIRGMRAELVRRVDERRLAILEQARAAQRA
jgi:hypothetical protein